MNYLAPSILSADFAKLGEDVSCVEKNGLKMLHIDVMDGMFVPSVSFGFPVIESIRKTSDMFFDVHLMMEKPERYIERFAAAGADGISVHAEACPHLDRVVHQIKETGKKCCVALNPSTPLTALDYILPELDMVLLMTVNPGFGGQKYIPIMSDKIRALRKRITELGLDIDIEVDGGIKLQNIKDVAEAGANVFVAGSAVFEGDIAKNVKDFKQALGGELQ